MATVPRAEARTDPSLSTLWLAPMLTSLLAGAPTRMGNGQRLVCDPQVPALATRTVAYQSHLWRSDSRAIHLSSTCLARWTTKLDAQIVEPHFGNFRRPPRPQSEVVRSLISCSLLERQARLGIVPPAHHFLVAALVAKRRAKIVADAPGRWTRRPERHGIRAHPAWHHRVVVHRGCQFLRCRRPPEDPPSGSAPACA